MLWVGLSCLCTGHFQLPPSPCQGCEHHDRCQAGRAKTPCPCLPVLFSLSWSPLPITYCQVQAYTICPRRSLCRGTPKQSTQMLLQGRWESCSIVAGLHGHASRGPGLSLVSYGFGGAVPRCLISVGKQAQNSSICKADCAKLAEGTERSWEKREVAKLWQCPPPGAHGTGRQGGLIHQKKALRGQLPLARCWPNKATRCCSCSADPG